MARPDKPLADGKMPNCTLLGTNFCIITNDYPMGDVDSAVSRNYDRVRLMYEELHTVGDDQILNESDKPGKFACESQQEWLRPGWAKDEITKEWMLVVNTHLFPQRIRVETCRNPKQACSFVAPFYESSCEQRYSLHRLIALDPHDAAKSPVVALFKFPAGCACRVNPVKLGSADISERN